MTHGPSSTTSRFGRTLACVGLVSVALVTSSAGVLAQSKPSAEQAKAKPPAAAAVKAYETGVKAFDKGKVDSAVSSLSTALRQGGLPSDKMAKALFYRGSAYRKQGKPAQAISDLTSAVWIKGGLSDADRLSAIEQRKAAYKEAGLGTRVPTNLKPGGSVASTAPAKPVAVAVAQPSSPVAIPAPPPPAPPVTSTSSGAATSAWQTTAAAPAAPAPSPAPSSVSRNASPITPPGSLSAMPRGPSTPTAAPTPQSAPSTSTGTGVGSALSNIGSSISQGASNVGSFFGNIFSSNSASTPTQPQPTQIATSSTARPVASVPAPGAAPSQGAIGQGWGPATTSSATTPPPQPRQRSAALKPPPKPPVPAAAPKARGKFRLQVAAVRSEAKAQQVVAALKTKYASELGGATPEIDAAAIGNMGTFYRVRVGPYADTTAPRGLCSRLKPEGYDCLIVTP